MSSNPAGLRVGSPGTVLFHVGQWVADPEHENLRHIALALLNDPLRIGGVMLYNFTRINRGLFGSLSASHSKNATPNTLHVLYSVCPIEGPCRSLSSVTKLYADCQQVVSKRSQPFRAYNFEPTNWHEPDVRRNYGRRLTFLLLILIIRGFAIVVRPLCFNYNAVY